MKLKLDVADYPYSIKKQVFLYETDAFGHTNNVAYFQYLESARFELLKAMHLFDPRDILSCNYILAHAECDYKKISRYDDILRIFCRISGIRNSSFGIEHLIINERTGDLVATARVVIVAYDHKRGESIPLSEDVKKRLEAFQ